MLDSIFNVIDSEIAHATGWSQATISTVADEYVAPAIVSGFIVWLLWHIFRLVHKPSPLSTRAESVQKSTPAAAEVADANPAPDTTVKWAFGHLCRATGLNASEDDTRPVWRQIRQAAHDGRIAVWGRAESATLTAEQFTKPIQIVPPTHWRHYDFDELQCLVGDDDTSFARTKPDDEKKYSIAAGYADLRLNRAEIEAISGQPTTKITLKELYELARRQLELSFSEKSYDAYFLSKALRQAGVDGAIKFFGRKLQNGLRSGITFKGAIRTHLLTSIPATHFNDYWIEFQPITSGEDNANTHTHAIGLNSPLMYSDLHADRTETEQWLRQDARALMASYRRSMVQ